jgi:hypothetical protein
MKVDLEKVRLSMTAMTEDVCVGIPDKDNQSFVHKHNVTNDFIKTVIDWCGGYKRTISGGGKKYEITCKEIKKL